MLWHSSRSGLQLAEILALAATRGPTMFINVCITLRYYSLVDSSVQLRPFSFFFALAALEVRVDHLADDLSHDASQFGSRGLCTWQLSSEVLSRYLHKICCS